MFDSRSLHDSVDKKTPHSFSSFSEKTSKLLLYVSSFFFFKYISEIAFIILKIKKSFILNGTVLLCELINVCGAQALSQNMINMIKY